MLFAVLAELVEPVLAAVPGVAVCDVEHEQRADSCTVVADDDASVPLASAGVPYLRTNIDFLLRLKVRNLDRLGLKLNPNGRHLACEDASVVALKNVALAYTKVASEDDLVAEFEELALATIDGSSSVSGRKEVSNQLYTLTAGLVCLLKPKSSL